MKKAKTYPPPLPVTFYDLAIVIGQGDKLLTFIPLATIPIYSLSAINKIILLTFFKITLLQ